MRGGEGQVGAGSLPQFKDTWWGGTPLSGTWVWGGSYKIQDLEIHHLIAVY